MRILFLFLFGVITLLTFAQEQREYYNPEFHRQKVKSVKDRWGISYYDKNGRVYKEIQKMRSNWFKVFFYYEEFFYYNTIGNIEKISGAGGDVMDSVQSSELLQFVYDKNGKEVAATGFDNSQGEIDTFNELKLYDKNGVLIAKERSLGKLREKTIYKNGSDSLPDTILFYDNKVNYSIGFPTYIDSIRLVRKIFRTYNNKGILTLEIQLSLIPGNDNFNDQFKAIYEYDNNANLIKFKKWRLEMNDSGSYDTTCVIENKISNYKDNHLIESKIEGLRFGKAYKENINYKYNRKGLLNKSRTTMYESYYETPYQIRFKKSYSIVNKFHYCYYK